MKKNTCLFLILGLAASFLASCSYSYTRQGGETGRTRSGASQTPQTNDVFVNVHVTNEPPEKVTMTFEATNTTKKLKVPMEVNIKATNSSPPTELPLDVKVQNEKTDKVTVPVSVELESKKSEPFSIPIKFVNQTNEPLIVPVKFVFETNTIVKTETHSPTGFAPKDLWNFGKFFADLWTLIKKLFSEGFFLLWLAFCGFVGGYVKTALPYLPKSARTKNAFWDNVPNEELALNCILGIFGGLIMPAALYLIRGDIFSNESWSFLVVTSAALLGGVIGPNAIRGLLSKKK